MPVHTNPFHEAVVAEIASLIAVLGGFVMVLPALGAGLECVWYMVCIGDWVWQRFFK